MNNNELFFIKSATDNISLNISNLLYLIDSHVKLLQRELQEKGLKSEVLAYGELESMQDIAVLIGENTLKEIANLHNALKNLEN
ncbi:MAG: hypothetical protein KH274_00300 [Veillonella sp. oral taxon 780]|jgi:hypothetical protein|nr:hypothetical protein [Veillonella sp. oral taxon 780]